MASVTTRDFDPKVKERLRVRAARHGCSIEDAMRPIFEGVTDLPEPQEDLATIAQNLFGAWGRAGAAAAGTKARTAQLRVMLLLNTDVVSELMRPASAPGGSVHGRDGIWTPLRV